MIDPEHDLPIKQQAEVLGISRSTVYYQPRPVSDEDLWLMRRIDELHLEYPFAGSRMLRDMLARQGLQVGRRHIKTLMRKMSIEAIYRGPTLQNPRQDTGFIPTCCAARPSRVPIRVWAIGHNVIPMARGFVYLAAVIDSRHARTLRVNQSTTAAR